MRVLFTTTGMPGTCCRSSHSRRACVRAGHEVAVAAERSRAGAIERLGLTARPFDDADPAAWAPLMAELPALAQPDGDALMIGAGFAGVGTRAALPGVLEIVEDWRPDLVVRESYHFAGALAAERHGDPARARRAGSRLHRAVGRGPRRGERRRGCGAPSASPRIPRASGCGARPS